MVKQSRSMCLARAYAQVHSVGFPVLLLCAKLSDCQRPRKISSRSYCDSSRASAHLKGLCDDGATEHSR